MKVKRFCLNSELNSEHITFCFAATRIDMDSHRDVIVCFFDILLTSQYMEK